MPHDPSSTDKDALRQWLEELYALKEAACEKLRLELVETNHHSLQSLLQQCAAKDARIAELVEDEQTAQRQANTLAQAQNEIVSLLTATRNESAEWMRVALRINEGMEHHIIEDGERRHLVLASPEAWAILNQEAAASSQARVNELERGGDSHNLQEQLSSMLLNGTTRCPLCGRDQIHEHSPEEIVIYRNGVKCGRPFTDSELNIAQARWKQLRQYAKHTPGCPGCNLWSPCTCGLSDLLSTPSDTSALNAVVEKAGASQARCAALEKVLQEISNLTWETQHDLKQAAFKAVNLSAFILSTPSDTSALDAVVEKAKREAVEQAVHNIVKNARPLRATNGFMPCCVEELLRAANLPAQGEGE